MKHKLYLVLIWGWFFAMQAQYDESGAKVTSVIGPFKTEQACKAELAYAQDLVESQKLEVKFLKCYHNQEA